MSTLFIVASLGVIYFLAHAFASIFSRTKIPDVLFLMLIGMCLGPFFGLVDSAEFGTLGTVFVTVTLIVILFQSGTGIRIKTLLKAWSRGVALTLLNFVLTTLAVGAILLLVTNLPPVLAFMVGAIVGGTSSAIVIPLLGQLKMQDESRAILLLESVLTDVLCIVVALALLGLYKAGSLNIGRAIAGFLSYFVLSPVLGIGAGIFWAFLLSRMRTLHDSIFATLAFVLILFGVAELLGATGYIAALAFGVTIGNVGSFNLPMVKTKLSPKFLLAVGLTDIEQKFFSEAVFLFKTFFFVYIGISIRIENLWWMGIGLIISVAALALRVPVVRFSIPRSTLVKDVSIMAIMVPKGLAAAALASIPLQQGIANGELIQSVVFAVVLFSIALTSVFIFLTHNTPVSRFYQLLFSGYGSATEPNGAEHDVSVSPRGSDDQPK